MIKFRLVSTRWWDRELKQISHYGYKYPWMKDFICGRTQADAKNKLEMWLLVWFGVN